MMTITFSHKLLHPYQSCGVRVQGRIYLSVRTSDIIMSGIWLMFLIITLSGTEAHFNTVYKGVQWKIPHTAKKRSYSSLADWSTILLAKVSDSVSRSLHQCINSQGWANLLQTYWKQMLTTVMGDNMQEFSLWLAENVARDFISQSQRWKSKATLSSFRLFYHFDQIARDSERTKSAWLSQKHYQICVCRNINVLIHRLIQPHPW